MTKTARFLPISLLLLGALLLLAGMLAFSGTTTSVQGEAGSSAKYSQITNFKATGTSNGKSPCGASKSAPPPYKAQGGKSEQCKPTP